MNLTAIRHCESIGNKKRIVDDNAVPNGENDALSESGREQAQQLAKELEKHQFDVIIMSPFRRTRETIAPYLTQHEVPVVVSDLVGERNAGVWKGKMVDDIKSYCDEHGIKDRVSWKPEGGESILDVYERAKSFLDYLKESFPAKSVLVCSHTNFLRCLDILIVGADIFDFYDGEEIRHSDVKTYALAT